MSLPAFGQSMTRGIMSPPANVHPPGLKNVGIEQLPDNQIPADLIFRDEAGIAELVRLMRESVRGSWLLSDVPNKIAWLDPKTSIALAVGVTSQGDECMTTQIRAAPTRQPLREIIERAEVAGTSS